ncbi:hypothetical protein ABFZ85_12140 [Hyphococcus formosus]|uniref:hypothetical protein n=1 Tax=Hyphococcus formosus TaxID=3143534 RepID=UPI00398B8189
MPSAEITLKDGTNITINGSTEEVARILSLYKSAGSQTKKRSVSPNKKQDCSTKSSESPNQEIDLAAMANIIRDCDQAEVFEAKILDQQDVVNRILMCLYVNKKYFSDHPPMTTGEISKLLKQLGIPVATANVSTAISRKAKAFVMTDAVRTKGAIIRYELNRRGMQHFEEIIGG